MNRLQYLLATEKMLLFPFPKKEREQYLADVRAAVERYQTQIEGRTGVNLGEVSVRDYRCIYHDMFKAVENELSLKAGGGMDTLRKVDFIVIKAISYPIAKVSMLGVEDSVDILAMDSTIYVAFGFTTRYQLFINQLHRKENRPDQLAVHGLSHILWNRLEGERKEDKNKVVWREGFATYCQEKWFSDFYPEGYPVKVQKKGEIGKQKIEELVKMHGQDILLKVPSEWKTFDSDSSLN